MSELHPGTSSYPFRDITVNIHRPASFTPQSPVLMVMHGRKRNGDEYCEYFAAESERRGFLVVAPTFGEAAYPHPHAYNYGRMVDGEGHLQPREQWIYPMLDEIFDDAREKAGSTRDRFFLFGHSAGSQLVHRLATFNWLDRIEHAVAANAGSYTMPVRGERYPFGLNGTGVSDESTRALFARPLTILLGDKDTDAQDPELPREPEAMRQGPYRFARGHHYFDVAKQEAARLGVPLAWKLAVAPGVAHSGRDMAPFAVKALGL